MFEVKLTQPQHLGAREVMKTYNFLKQHPCLPPTLDKQSCLHGCLGFNGLNVCTQCTCVATTITDTADHVYVRHQLQSPCIRPYLPPILNKAIHNHNYICHKVACKLSTDWPHTMIARLPCYRPLNF